MSVISYRLDQELIPDDVREAMVYLYNAILNQDWHGMQVTIMRNGYTTLDVQMVVKDETSKGGD